MKILVYPHDMNLGGSQLNAIELAAAVKDLGYDVAVAGQHGSLRAKVGELGLEFIELPEPGRRPSRKVVSALEQAIAQRGIDIVHGYEWPPSLEAELACFNAPATAVSTVLSMSVAPFIPTHTPLLVGTEQIAAAEREFGRALVELMEPPIDTRLNRPGLELPVREMSQRWGIHGGGLTIAIVSRLAREMKLEGILRAIEVIGRIPGGEPVQLVIAGGGPAAGEVAAAADEANRRAGQLRVVLTGELEDPRWVYQKADIVLGMGGSILRAMAFGKPAVVQGESGFWRVVDESSLPGFLFQGWYGAGAGSGQGADALQAQLRPLLADAALRQRLGDFARRVVVERFSLQASARRQVQFYRQVLAQGQGRNRLGAEYTLAAARFARYKFSRLAARMRGSVAADDFNATAALRSAGAPGRPAVRA